MMLKVRSLQSEHSETSMQDGRLGGEYKPRGKAGTVLGVVLRLLKLFEAFSNVFFPFGEVSKYPLKTCGEITPLRASATPHRGFLGIPGNVH